jgi:acyl-CoA synthetase (AMP-forming)/AMP-acid ligase II
MITPLPIFHMNAMAYSLMAMIAVGGCLTALDRFHPRSWWDSVRAARATCLHYLGVMPSMLMSAAPGPQDRDHQAASASVPGLIQNCTPPSKTASAYP